MRNLIGTLLTALALTLGATSQAATVQADTKSVDLSALSQKQQDDILQKIADAKQTPVDTQLKEAAQTANKWVEIGHAIGTTLVSTARDLGVTANEFAATPVGKVIVAIVIWKYLASDFIHIGGGLVFMALGVWLGLKFLRRANVRKVSSETWVPQSVLWGLFTRQKLVAREYSSAEQLKESEQWMQAFGYFCIVASAIICLCLI